MRLIIFLILAVTYFSCSSQSVLDKSLGGWSGQLEEENAFKFTVTLSRASSDQFGLDLRGNDGVSSFILNKGKDNVFRGEDDEVKVQLGIDSGSPTLFIQVGHHLCHVPLIESDDTWKGDWNLLIVDEIKPTLYLSLSKDDGLYSASTFFKEPSLHYMWGRNFQSDEGTIEFQDVRSTIDFEGRLDNDQIRLSMTFLNERSEVILQRLDFAQWNIGSADDIKAATSKGARSKFKDLIEAIENDTLDGTHSVVVIQNDNIIFEEYFDGFSIAMPHDTRSASKSLAGAIVGLAIDDGLLKSEKSTLKSYYELSYPSIDWSNGKDSIDIHHLLTMSSGLDAIDFGLDRTSYANEGNYQSQPDWTKHVLDAPMVNEVGVEGNYGSGSPHLLSPIVQSVLGEPLEFYIHRKLFHPMGIENYRIQTTNEGIPYFGGGWYLTPRDLAKFGSLYLNQGQWKDKQIISSEWIAKSVEKYVTLENTWDKNEYGYFFWHNTYEVGNKLIASIEARGFGGQYICIVPEFDLVVAITSGNYRNNRGFQPERIMQDFILKDMKE